MWAALIFRSVKNAQICFEWYTLQAKNIILVECNLTGQLGRLIREKTGLKIKNRLLKYNGRPFHSDELNNLLKNRLNNRLKNLLKPWTTMDK